MYVASIPFPIHQLGVLLTHMGSFTFYLCNYLGRERTVSLNECMFDI
jgi:hypothetical protein